MKRSFLPSPGSWSALSLFLVVWFTSPLRSQDLPLTDSLQLWLKADAGTTLSGNKVTGWEDQSGNANHAAALDEASAPILVPNVLNGRPVLHFDGVDDSLAIPDSESLSIVGDLTTFFVVRFDDFATFRAVWAKTLSNQPGPNDWYVQPANSLALVYRGDGFGTNGSVPGNVPISAGRFLTLGWSAFGTHITHYLGDQIAGEGDTFTTVSDANTPLRIGTRDDLFTKMKGDIAEILIYNRLLNPTERNAVVAYLGAKYNITNLPPTISLTGNPATPTVAAGTTVTLNANATDPDGTITKVTFFLNGAPIATATAAPFGVRVQLTTPGAYSFTAQAVDNLSASANSNEVGFTVTAGAPPPLTVLNNLQLWLKADAGVTSDASSAVSVWQDQSGQGNHALSTFAPPTLITNGINSNPVIRFDGADDYLEIPDSDSLSITGDITTFWVARFDDLFSYRVVWAKTSGNLAAPTDWWTLNNEINLWRGNGAAYQSVGASTALTAGIPQIAGFSMAGTTATHYLNGLVNGTGTITAAGGDANTSLMIGTRADFVTRMKGDIAEIVIYNAALSAPDRASVQAYLAGKYGLNVPIGNVINSSPAITVSIAPNQPTFAPGSTITLSAAATDSDGSVARVDYFANGSFLGSATQAPYNFQATLATAGTYNFSARATDNLGAITVSPVTTCTATGTDPAFTVPSALRLWLKADTGVTLGTNANVIGWADQSGSGNNAFTPDEFYSPQLVPGAMNGRPALRFDGVDDYLEVLDSESVSIAGDLTSFFVVTFDDLSFYRVVWAKTGPNALAAPTDWWTRDAEVHLFRGDGTVFGDVPATVPFTAAVPQLAGFMMQGVNVTHFLNARPNGTGIISAPVADTDQPLRIGTRGDFLTRMKGDIAEILIFDRALAPGELSDVQTYLAGKYGIPVVGLPVPTLTASRSGNQVTVSWPDGFPSWKLESTTDLTLPWEPVLGVSGHSYTESIVGKKYYRLRL